MKKIIIIFLTISVVFVTACTDSKTGSDENLEMEILPAEMTIVQNQTAQFSLNVENAEDLFGVSVEINFDSTLIEIPENCLESGDFWGNSATFSQPVSESGRLNIICSLFNGDEPISGSGQLLKFTLQGISAGSSPLTIYRVHLINENGESISGIYDLEISNGMLTIE